MSRYEYEVSRDLASQDLPFYGLLMAAMLRADTDNSDKLHTAFPDVREELQARYNAPGGVLPDAPVSEQACSRCEGEGEVYWNPSHIGDPQAEMYAPCSACGGTGLATDQDQEVPF